MTITNRANRAFTVIEMLTALAIIAVLAAISLPIISAAKASGHQAEQIAKMREGVVALRLYAEDNGDYPIDYSTSKKVFMELQPCAAYDPWNPNCKLEEKEPRLGSWGYVRLVSRFRNEADWQREFSEIGNRPLLISFLFARRVPKRFEGEVPPRFDYDPPNFRQITYAMPDVLLTAREDGSVRRTQHRTCVSTGPNSEICQIMTWTSIFSKPDEK